jgi:hypothetical protein
MAPILVVSRAEMSAGFTFTAPSIWIDRTISESSPDTGACPTRVDATTAGGEVVAADGIAADGVGDFPLGVTAVAET